MNHPDLSPDGSPREQTWRNPPEVIGHNAINKCTTATHMDANHPRPSPSPTCEVNQTFPREWLTAKLCGQFKDRFRQEPTSHFNFILNTQTPTLTLDVFTCRFDIFDFFYKRNCAVSSSIGFQRILPVTRLRHRPKLYIQSDLCTVVKSAYGK